MVENATSDGRLGSRWRVAVWGGAALLPLLLVATGFTRLWDETDFFVFGAMLVAGCGGYELAAKKSGDAAYRAAAAVALAGAFLLVWINLAVGVIGNEDDPANLMFGGVLAIGMTGALLSRFRPGGMARAMVAMAFAQVLVAVVALSAGWGATGPDWQWQILGLTGFFASLWIVSAWLFRIAARKRS